MDSMFCYCAESRRLSRLLSARYDAALAAAGVTAAQFETLSVLQRLGKSTGGALADRLVLDKTTLSRNLKPLLDAKLVAVKRGEEDGRERFYSVTASGQRKVAKALPLWEQVHASSVALLGEQALPTQLVMERAATLLRTADRPTQR